MAIIPTLPTSQSADSFTHQLLALSLPASADSLQIADACAAFASVLVETDDAETRRALCGRLLDALGQLHSLCDSDLSPYLVKQLLEGEKIDSCAPDCWQNTATQVEYAQALTQAIQGGTLSASVEKTLTGLLHDMVWLLAEFVKESSVTQAA